MSHVRRAVAGALCTLAIAVPALLPASAHAASPTVDAAVAYLGTQQLPNGGWDANAASQFITEDTVLAIAEAAQTTSTWSTSEALIAVQATKNAGQDPMAFLADVQTAATTPGRAAKFIVLVAAPLGLDTTALATTLGDPENDGHFGDPTAFYDTLYAALASYLVHGSVPASTLTYIRAQQQADGGWTDGFPGDPEDPDTTSTAVMALAAGGATSTDTSVRQALGFLASQQNADGTWSAFGSESSESTSRAMLGISAAGFDPNDRCWRDTALPSSSASPFVGGDTALTSLAHPDGSIAGPGSFFAAYSTAQAVQGLERNWLPVVRGSSQSCNPTPPPESTSPAPVVAEAVVVAPSFTG
jgi:hypothetical protein